MTDTLLGLAGIIVVGVAAQWLAWRTRLPAILLLLIAGFLVGGVTGWLDPDALLGPTLFPIVSLSVAIILFEGGLSLNIAELRTIGRAVRNLISIGVLATWGLAAVAAHYLLAFDWALATLLGAICIVTGPTVIIPLLRQIRPSPRVSSIVRWEGLVNDPIGAICAVLVFEVVLATGGRAELAAAWEGIAKAVLAGSVLGLGGAALIVFMLRRHWVPDYLQSPVALGVVVAVFAASNGIMEEVGLLTVTVMGSALASQKMVSIRNILEFKENLRVLLIAALFIVLAARLPLDNPVYREPGSWLFLGVLIVVVRPVSVFLAGLRTGMTWQHQVFLCTMAPRGIVAAAVASIFGLELVDLNYPGSERFAPVMFMVIVGTVVFYGVAAGPIARVLGLARADPDGVLFVGASAWVRDLAKVLSDHKVAHLLVDSNWRNVSLARQRGLSAYYGNVLSDRIRDDLPLDGIGRLLAMTPNDEVNTLAVLHLEDIFGRQRSYQLAPAESLRESAQLPRDLQGRVLFRRDATHTEIERRYRAGAVVKQTPLTEEFDFDDYMALYGDDVIPMFVVQGNRLRVVDASESSKPKAGQVVIALVQEEPDAERKGPA